MQKLEKKVFKNRYHGYKNIDTLGRMQRQGNKSPRNKPGLRLNLVLLKLVFKWYAETWFKLGLTKPSLNKLGLIKTGLN